MGLSVDNITAKFPAKTIPSIQGEPDYATISNMVQFMYGNAASLPTTLGGSQHGHVGLIMTPILYNTLSNTPYTAPANPGPSPTHAHNASATTRETARLRHKEETPIYDNHQNMDDAR
jgi:hypothetical protein